MEFILSQPRFVFHIGKLCAILNIFPHCPLSGGGICRSRYGGRRHGWRGDCRRAISNPRGCAPRFCEAFQRSLRAIARLHPIPAPSNVFLPDGQLLPLRGAARCNNRASVSSPAGKSTMPFRHRISSCRSVCKRPEAVRQPAGYRHFPPVRSSKATSMVQDFFHSSA